jgi:hypothetical protein
MTIDKDFKELVRARMEKTGESYTAARAHLRREEDEDEDDGATYGLAADGRWLAQSRETPEHVGYGPTKQRAWHEMFGRQFDSIFKRRRTNVLTYVETKEGKWTARATENLSVLGEGAHEEDALRDWRAKVGLDPQRIWENRYTRTVYFKEHADGRWSAKSDRHDQQIGWGKDKNEAEENLIEAEYDYDCDNDQPEDYGYYKDD